MHRGALLADRLRVFVSQRLAVALLGRHPSGADPGRYLEHPDGIRAEIIEVRGDIRVETHQDGRHGDERGDADDHAQHSEKRTQLVLPQRVQCHRRVFAERYSHGFQVTFQIS